jgi:hypothetical protein
MSKEGKQTINMEAEEAQDRLIHVELVCLAEMTCLQDVGNKPEHKMFHAARHTAKEARRVYFQTVPPTLILWTPLQQHQVCGAIKM